MLLWPRLSIINDKDKVGTGLCLPSAIANANTRELSGIAGLIFALRRCNQISPGEGFPMKYLYSRSKGIETEREKGGRRAKKGATLPYLCRSKWLDIYSYIKTFQASPRPQQRPSQALHFNPATKEVADKKGWNQVLCVIKCWMIGGILYRILIPPLIYGVGGLLTNIHRRAHSSRPQKYQKRTAYIQTCLALNYL